MRLNDVNKKVAGKSQEHRIGRGPGSGWGCTAGRGEKGAKSRASWKRRLNMDGGQMTFIRRIPKRGFTNALFKRDWAFVNLRDLETFEAGSVVTPEECLRRGIIPKVRAGLKVLGVGELTKSLTVHAHRASAKARAAIEAAGGKLEPIVVPADTAKASWKQKRGQGKRSTRRKQAKQRAKKG